LFPSGVIIPAVILSLSTSKPHALSMITSIEVFLSMAHKFETGSIWDDIENNSDGKTNQDIKNISPYY
jgi:hypothetical protein